MFTVSRVINAVDPDGPDGPAKDVLLATAIGIVIPVLAVRTFNPRIKRWEDAGADIKLLNDRRSSLKSEFADTASAIRETRPWGDPADELSRMMY
ncbi:Uncharacterized protein AC510_4568 [Pseudomonas amygdali pv. myricae]|nr:Uncharacterized protein AC510_4568 [Pseudomonas amygdali pv. myricae]